MGTAHLRLERMAILAQRQTPALAIVRSSAAGTVDRSVRRRASGPLGVAAGSTVTTSTGRWGRWNHLTLVMRKE